MPKYMDVHDGFVGVTAEQLREARHANLAIEGNEIEGKEGVHYDRAWMDPVNGRVFCLVTGPSKEAAMRVHRYAGHPTDQVHELTVEV